MYQFEYYSTLSEPAHPAAQVLRTVLLPVQLEERAHGGDEQSPAVGHQDARKVRPEGLHLQAQGGLYRLVSWHVEDYRWLPTQWSKSAVS